MASIERKTTIASSKADTRKQTVKLNKENPPMSRCPPLSVCSRSHKFHSMVVVAPLRVSPLVSISISVFISLLCAWVLPQEFTRPPLIPLSIPARNHHPILPLSRLLTPHWSPYRVLCGVGQVSPILLVFARCCLLSSACLASTVWLPLLCTVYIGPSRWLPRWYIAGGLFEVSESERFPVA